MSKTSQKLKGLSLDRLESLSAICAAGSITRATGNDSVKQSLYSRQVAELESWFGVKLLDRTSTPSKPTLEAERIIRHFDLFLSEMHLLHEEAADARRAITFGAGERMIRSYLIPWSSKIDTSNVKLVFRNLTSKETRNELIARRLDFGILRKEQCPHGFERVDLKPIPMCFLMPNDLAASRAKWDWIHLAHVPLVMMEGAGSFYEYVMGCAAGSNANLDIAIECSSWFQAAEAMAARKISGFLPKDLEPNFPPGFVRVNLKRDLNYSEAFVIAWSGDEVKKRPEAARMAASLKPSLGPH